MSEATAAPAAVAAVSPPRRSPRGRERASSRPRENKRPPPPRLQPPHSRPELPTVPCGARVRHRRLRPLPAQQAMLATGKDARRGCCLVKGLISCIPLRSFPPPPLPKRGERWKALTSFSLFFFKSTPPLPGKNCTLKQLFLFKMPTVFLCTEYLLQIWSATNEI